MGLWLFFERNDEWNHVFLFCLFHFFKFLAFQKRMQGTSYSSERNQFTVFHMQIISANQESSIKKMWSYVFKSYTKAMSKLRMLQVRRVYQGIRWLYRCNSFLSPRIMTLKCITVVVMTYFCCAQANSPVNFIQNGMEGKVLLLSQSRWFQKEKKKQKNSRQKVC